MSYSKKNHFIAVFINVQKRERERERGKQKKANEQKK